MSDYDISLIFAEILSIILAAIWIIYKIRNMDVNDLLINISTYLLMIYVAIGNLIYQFSKGD